MTEKQFLRRWYTSLTAGVAIVAAVAGLLVAIIGTARSILHHAGRALAIANEIVANTRPIWDLETTNRVAVQLLDGATAIAGHAAEVADLLDPPLAAGHGSAT